MGRPSRVVGHVGEAGARGRGGAARPSVGGGKEKKGGAVGLPSRPGREGEKGEGRASSWGWTEKEEKNIFK